MEKALLDELTEFRRELHGFPEVSGEERETGVSSVVKGNTYGHGLAEFVETAEKCGQNHFSVFSTNEELAVKTVAKNNPIIDDRHYRCG